MTARKKLMAEAKPEKEGSAGVDAYVAVAAPDARVVLKKIRALVKRAVPGATETISYRIPALRLGRVFFYYAAFKKHIGIFPPVRSDKKLMRELEPFRGPKGNLQFPLDEPMPYELIGRVAAALAKEYGKVLDAQEMPKVALRRLTEVRSGKVKTIPGKEGMEQVRRSLRA